MFPTGLTPTIATQCSLATSRPAAIVIPTTIALMLLPSYFAGSSSGQFLM